MSNVIVSSRFSGACRSERGSVTIMVALSMLLLLIALGTAIDMARAQILQSRISSALDSAGLAAALMADTVDVQTEATKYFNLNFPSGYLESLPVTVTATLSTDKTKVDLTATTSLQTSFMRTAGITTVPIVVNSEVTRNLTCKPQNIYVADPGNHRVEVFDGSGNYVSQFGNVAGPGYFSSGPYDIHVDNSGHIWVTADFIGSVFEFDQTGAYLSSFGTSGSGAGQFLEADGVAVDTSGNIWATDLDNAKVEKWTNLETYVSSIGTAGNGSGPNQLNGPAGINFDASNNLWVVDQHNSRIVEFNPSTGNQTLAFGSFGAGPGQFDNPWGVAIDGSGNIWVTDTSNERIQKFSKTGAFIASYGVFGSGNGQFQGPVGISIDSCNNIWVTDQSNNRVQEFDTSGNYISQFGSAGSGNGQFNTPVGIYAQASTQGVGQVYIDK